MKKQKGTPIKRVHTNLDLLMDQNGIKTDSELASKLDIAPQTLSMRLRNNISIKTLTELSDFFGITVKEFLR